MRDSYYSRLPNNLKKSLFIRKWFSENSKELQMSFHFSPSFIFFNFYFLFLFFGLKIKIRLKHFWKTVFKYNIINAALMYCTVSSWMGLSLVQRVGGSPDGTANGKGEKGKSNDLQSARNLSWSFSHFLWLALRPARVHFLTFHAEDPVPSTNVFISLGIFFASGRSTPLWKFGTTPQLPFSSRFKSISFALSLSLNHSLTPSLTHSLSIYMCVCVCMYVHIYIYIYIYIFLLDH